MDNKNICINECIVGRETQLNRLNDIYNNVLQNKGSKAAVFFYGIGGIGKSFLFDKWIEIKEENLFVKHSFDNKVNKNTNIIGLMDLIYNKIQSNKKTKYFNDYIYAKACYFSKINNEEIDDSTGGSQNVMLSKVEESIYGTLQDIMSNPILKIALALVKNLKPLGRLNYFIDKISKQNNENIQEIYRYYSQNSGNESIIKLEELCIKYFTNGYNEFIKETSKKSNYEPMIICLDDVEYLTINLFDNKTIKYLFDSDKGLLYNLSNTMWIMCGRNDIGPFEQSKCIDLFDSNKQIEDKILIHKLELLSFDETKIILNNYQIYDEEKIKKIYEITDGLPFLIKKCVELFADNEDIDINSLTKKEDIISRYIQRYFDPDQRRMIYRMALLGEWEENDIIKMSLEPNQTKDSIKDTLSSLLQESFIKKDQNNQGIYYFQKSIRELVLNSEALYESSLKMNAIDVNDNVSKIIDIYLEKYRKINYFNKEQYFSAIDNIFYLYKIFIPKSLISINVLTKTTNLLVIEGNGTYFNIFSQYDNILLKYAQQISNNKSDYNNIMILHANDLLMQNKIDEAIDIYEEIYTKEKDSKSILNDDYLLVLNNYLRVLKEVDEKKACERIEKEYENYSNYVTHNSCPLIYLYANTVKDNHKKFEALEKIYNFYNQSKKIDYLSIQSNINYYNELFNDEQIDKGFVVIDEILRDSIEYFKDENNEWTARILSDKGNYLLTKKDDFISAGELLKKSLNIFLETNIDTDSFRNAFKIYIDLISIIYSKEQNKIILELVSIYEKSLAFSWDKRRYINEYFKSVFMRSPIDLTEDINRKTLKMFDTKGDLYINDAIKFEDMYASCLFSVGQLQKAYDLFEINFEMICDHDDKFSTEEKVELSWRFIDMVKHEENIDKEKLKGICTTLLPSAQKYADLIVKEYIYLDDKDKLLEYRLRYLAICLDIMCTSDKFDAVDQTFSNFVSQSDKELSFETNVKEAVINVFIQVLESWHNDELLTKIKNFEINNSAYPS